MMSNSNEINITISGSAGTGKTTIARFIKMGLAINVDKEDQKAMHDNTTIDDYDGQNEVGDLHDLIEAINRLSEKGTKINIKTVQTPRKN